MIIVAFRQQHPKGKKTMILQPKDRISYNGLNYKVIAVIWSTLYLQKTDDGCGDYAYTMEEVCRYYKDVEIINVEGIREHS